MSDHGHDHHRHDDNGGGHSSGGHGHENDQGWRAILRYLRWAPQMWRSDINNAVVDLVAPAEGERVLDVGAGMGPATVQAAGRGASVVAVEPTPFMRRVLTARRQLNKARDRIEVVDGGAEALPVDDDSVDAVWSVNAMHHWVDVDKAAAEIARVLRPGGRVVLVDEDFQDPAHPEFERFGDHGDDDHHHGFTMVDAEQMGERLRSVGLVDVDAGKRQMAERPVIAITASGPN